MPPDQPITDAELEEMEKRTRRAFCTKCGFSGVPTLQGSVWAHDAPSGKSCPYSAGLLEPDSARLIAEVRRLRALFPAEPIRREIQ